MANRSKDKGDRAEREALAWLKENASHLCDVPKPDRKKSAGIPEDIGDMHFISTVSIQVKAWSPARMGMAVREAAVGAAAQAINGGSSHGIGMSLVQGARAGSVRWIASCLPATWIGPEPVNGFGTISAAVKWMRDDVGPQGYLAHPRTSRVCLLSGSGAQEVVLAPMEAWVQAYSRVIA